MSTVNKNDLINKKNICIKELDLITNLQNQFGKIPDSICDRDSLNKIDRYGYASYMNMYSADRPTYFMRTYSYIVELNNTLSSMKEMVTNELNNITKIIP